uniref:Chromatin modification-related protein MEAF6 n=1 Tax=Schistosoma mansoni TaxID=6183 RepID=A0A3Q0KUR1_SCHMA
MALTSDQFQLLIQRQEQRFRKSQLEFIDKLHAKLLNHPCFGGATEVDALISKLRTELGNDCRTNEYTGESLYESVKSSNLSETIVTYDQPISPVLSVSEACPIRGSNPTIPETKRANNESSSSQKDNILLSAHKIAAVPAHEETGNKASSIADTVVPNETNHNAKNVSNESNDQNSLIFLPDL